MWTDTIKPMPAWICMNYVYQGVTPPYSYSSHQEDCSNSQRVLSFLPLWTRNTLHCLSCVTLSFMLQDFCWFDGSFHYNLQHSALCFVVQGLCYKTFADFTGHFFTSKPALTTLSCPRAPATHCALLCWFFVLHLPVCVCLYFKSPWKRLCKDSCLGCLVISDCNPLHCWGFQGKQEAEYSQLLSGRNRLKFL